MVRNTFDKGPEGWCSYDYHWTVVAKGKNIFILTTWERSGGVNDSGYVWCDETRWSADTPESPVSVLPFIFYNQWVGLDPMDLREAQVSVYLRGDSLKLDGAECYFWAVGRQGRWHFNSNPLQIGDGRWTSEPNVFTLRNDESLWHRSWPGSDPSRALSLNELLGECISYGFSFVGFGREPHGKFSMDEFELTLANGQPG